jgi:hypothetical protein
VKSTGVVTLWEIGVSHHARGAACGVASVGM